MFGKREWFQSGSFQPACWQGWAYTGSWALVLLLPFVGLAAQGQWTEAVIWQVAAMGAMAYDVWLIRRQDQQPDASEPADPDEGSKLATRHYDFWLNDRNG